MKTYTYSYQNVRKPGPWASTDAGEAGRVLSKLGRCPRGLGKCQTSCFKVSDASEGSKHAAEGFRGVGASADGPCRGMEAGRIPEGTRMHVPR